MSDQPSTPPNSPGSPGGLHPKIIQDRLGHANISETMDVYGHLFPEADEAGRGAIDAMFVSGTGQTEHHVHG